MGTHTQRVRYVVGGSKAGMMGGVTVGVGVKGGQVVTSG